MAKKLSILYTESNMPFRNTLSNFFCEKEEIGLFDFAENGIQVLEKCKKYVYDIIVVDLALEKINGLSILDKLKEGKHQARIFVMSEWSSNVMIQQVLAKGADHFFLKSCNIHSIYEQMIAHSPSAELAPLGQEEPDTETNLYNKIEELVREAGISESQKGFSYITESIWQIHHDRSLINAVIKQLYPSVAEKFNVSHTKIERATRHAIEQAWEDNGFLNMNQFFIPNSLHRYDKPSNAEFIAMIADQLMLLAMPKQEEMTIDSLGRKN